MEVPNQGQKTGMNWWRLMWRYGGKAERFVILSFALGCALMPVPLLFMVPFSRLVTAPVWRQLGAGVAISGLTWTLFSRGVFEAMHNARFYRVALEEGDQSRLTPIEREYLAEWIRFKEAVGVSGQLPQITRSALLAIAVYFGAWLGVFPYIFFLYPLLGDWTVLSFAGFALPLYVSSWVLMRMEFAKLLADASLKGFRLAELRRQVIAGRGRARLAWF